MGTIKITDIDLINENVLNLELELALPHSQNLKKYPIKYCGFVQDWGDLEYYVIDDKKREKIENWLENEFSNAPFDNDSLNNVGHNTFIKL